MVVLLSVGDGKDDLNKRVEAYEAMLLVVDFRLEMDAIRAQMQRLSLRKQILAAAVRVGDFIVEKRPRAILHERKRDGNFGSGTSKRCVENMCRDAHG